MILGSWLRQQTRNRKHRLEIRDLQRSEIVNVVGSVEFEMLEGCLNNVQ